MPLDQDPQEASIELSPMHYNRRWTAYKNLLHGHLITLSREPYVIFWAYVFPLILSLCIGLAYQSRQGSVCRVALIHGADDEQILKLLGREAHHVEVTVLPSDDDMSGFRFSKFDLMITRRDGQLELWFDPQRTDSELALALVTNIIHSSESAPNPSVIAHASSSPGNRYIDFLIPGMLGMNLMSSGMWGVGARLIEMRQRNLLKRLSASPMRKSDFLLALSSSRIIMVLSEVLVLLVFGNIVFHVPVRGSWLSITFVSTLGGLTFCGLGLLSASRTRNAETANGLMNMVMVPMWIVSGVFFSYERFPSSLRPFIRILPLTALNDALRAVILQGAPALTQWANLLNLAVWGLASFLLARLLFKWV